MVDTRLTHLRRYIDADVQVVAPVPWFPSGAACFGKYALFARTLRDEIREGVKVHHPRYLMIPGLGMYMQPFTLMAGALPTIRAIRECGHDFEILDAHYFYPDGVAAALIARRMGTPLVITARGSDINLLPNFTFPRRLIVWAAQQASAVITVSAALKDKLSQLGVNGSKIHVLRNGVDLDLFKPVPQVVARRALDLSDDVIFASVGNLIPEKGHDLAIKAVAALPGVTLLIVGEGPEKANLGALARQHGVAHRVHLLAARPQKELCDIYSAANALILASSREGWPNVLLEAMACGTPVIATDVGGIPEIVRTREAGRVISERSSTALAQAMRELLDDPPPPVRVRQYAEQFGWDEVSQGQAELFQQVTRDHATMAR